TLLVALLHDPVILGTLAFVRPWMMFGAGG
ncbi:MAG: hypothetical protein RL385_2050, partial [Pseudomonadota bacterium]